MEGEIIVGRNKEDETMWNKASTVLTFLENPAVKEAAFWCGKRARHNHKRCVDILSIFQTTILDKAERYADGIFFIKEWLSNLGDVLYQARQFLESVVQDGYIKEGMNLYAEYSGIDNRNLPYTKTRAEMFWSIRLELEVLACGMASVDLIAFPAQEFPIMLRSLSENTKKSLFSRELSLEQTELMIQQEFSKNRRILNVQTQQGYDNNNNNNNDSRWYHKLSKRIKSMVYKPGFYRVLNAIFELVQLILLQLNSKRVIIDFVCRLLVCIISAICLGISVGEFVAEIYRSNAKWKKRGNWYWFYSNNGNGKRFGSFALYFTVFFSAVQFLTHLIVLCLKEEFMAGNLFALAFAAASAFAPMFHQSSHNQIAAEKSQV